MDRHRHSLLLANRAKSLRRDQTDAEQKMWTLLRSRALQGYKFRRQYIVGYYIVDFCCLEKKLAIELDGGHHKSRREYDERRTQFLEREGFLVLRFWDNEMLKEPEAVLNMILDVLESPYDQKPALSPP